jgi:hydrogenase maturation protease
MQPYISSMKTLVFGAGNLLLSDEGFGVHFVRYLEEHYSFPPEVTLLDAGTCGILAAAEIEAAERVYLVDVLAIKGEAGQYIRYGKDDIMLRRIPLKMSPHQIGVQEMLLISEMRGRCPEKISLLGVIPASLEPGTQLSPALQRRLIELAEVLVAELQSGGLSISPRNLNLPLS